MSGCFERPEERQMQDIPVIPKTTREILVALWYKINNGLTQQIAATHALAEDTACRVQNIEKLIPDLWTRAQHDAAHNGYVAQEKKNSAEQKMNRQQVVGLVIQGAIGLGTILTVVAMVLLSRGGK
jgi:hypothetical protein